METVREMIIYVVFALMISWANALPTNLKVRGEGPHDYSFSRAFSSPVVFSPEHLTPSVYRMPFQAPFQVYVNQLMPSRAKADRLLSSRIKSETNGEVLEKPVKHIYVLS